MMGVVTSRDEFDLTEEEIDAMFRAGEPVEVGGPPDVLSRPRFVVFQESAQHFGWRLVRPDGQVLAGSPDYSTKADALSALYAVMGAGADALLVDRTVG